MRKMRVAGSGHPLRPRADLGILRWRLAGVASAANVSSGCRSRSRQSSGMRRRAALTGALLSIEARHMDRVVAAMEALGYRCRRDDDLVARVSGYTDLHGDDERVFTGYSGWFSDLPRHLLILVHCRQEWRADHESVSRASPVIHHADRPPPSVTAIRSSDGGRPRSRGEVKNRKTGYLRTAHFTIPAPPGPPWRCPSPANDDRRAALRRGPSRPPRRLRHHQPQEQPRDRRLHQRLPRPTRRAHHPAPDGRRRQAQPDRGGRPGRRRPRSGPLRPHGRGAGRIGGLGSPTRSP